MIKRTLHFANPAYLSWQDQLMIDLPRLKVLGEKESRKNESKSQHGGLSSF